MPEPTTVRTTTPEPEPEPENTSTTSSDISDPITDPLAGGGTKKKELVTASVDPDDESFTTTVSGKKSSGSVTVGKNSTVLSGSETDESGTKRSVTGGYGDGTLSVGGSKIHKDKSGRSGSVDINVEEPGVKLSTTRTGTDESETSTSLGLSEEQLDFSRTSGKDKAKNISSVQLGKETGGTYVRNGKGFGGTVSEDGISLMGQNKKLKASGNVSYDGEVFKAGVDVKAGKRGVNLNVQTGDGETTVGGGASVGIVGGGVEYTSIDKTDNHFGQSELLGNSYEMTGTTGGGFGQSFQAVAGEHTKSRATSDVRVQQKLDGSGSYPVGVREEMGSLRDDLKAGKPLDVGRLGDNQGVELTRDTYDEEGGGLDILAYDVDQTDVSREISKRSIAKTDEGIRLRDTRTLQSGKVTESGYGLGLLHSSDDTEMRTDTEMLDYTLDPSDPFAVEYANDYAQVGLLPSWDVVAPEELVAEMRAALDAARKDALTAERWQAFLAKNDGLIREVNDHVRQDVRSESPTSTSGVTFNGSDRITNNTTQETSTTALFWSDASLESDNIQTRRYTSEEGESITERNWSEEKGGRSRSVTTSGGYSAESALKVEDEGMLKYQQQVLDLSPQVMQALGEQLNAGPHADHLWKNMTGSVVKYWQQRADFLSGTTSGRQPEDDFDLWSRVSNKESHALPAIFGAVTGPESFLALSPRDQLVYAETAAHGGGSADLYKGKRAMGSGFDAMAAISLIEDPDQRDRAVLALGRQVTQEGRDPSQELGIIGDELGGGGAGYLVDAARTGRQVDPGLINNDAEAWAAEMDALLKKGTAANASLYQLMVRAREAGGAAFVSELLAASDNSALDVAKQLAADSVDRPRDFCTRILAGTKDKARTDGWWGVVEGNLESEQILKLGEEIFSKPESQAKLDGQGLGGVGMDTEMVRAQMEMFEQQQQTTEMLAQWEAQREAMKGQPMLLTVTDKAIFAGQLWKVLKREPWRVASILDTVRKLSGPEGLDDLLTTSFQIYDFADAVSKDEAGLIKAQMKGTTFAQKMTSAGIFR